MIRKHLKTSLLRASHSRWGLALLQNPSEKTKSLIPTFDHSQGLDGLIWDIKDQFYTEHEKKFKNDSIDLLTYGVNVYILQRNELVNAIIYMSSSSSEVNHILINKSIKNLYFWFIYLFYLSIFCKTQCLLCFLQI